MKPLSQALQVARQLMASGKTGSALADGLRPAVSILSTQEKKKLASRIAREHFILGHAAHDPNLYKNCQAAKVAKDKSENPHFKILTYRTPMCDSCALNRQGSCGLMGGRLIDGPDDVPEKAVQRTADILRSEQVVAAGDVHRIAGERSPAPTRISALHARRSAALATPDRSGDRSEMARSRVASAILDPAGDMEIRPRRLVGPARRKNAERVGLGGIDEGGDRAGMVTSLREASVFDGDMNIVVPAQRRRRDASVQMDSTPEMDVPRFDRRASTATIGDDERSLEAQNDLVRLSRYASHLLGRGQVSTRRASKIYQHMNHLMDLGAVPTERVSAIHRQLNALGGGMET